SASARDRACVATGVTTASPPGSVGAEQVGELAVVRLEVVAEAFLVGGVDRRPVRMAVVPTELATPLVRPKPEEAEGPVVGRLWIAVEVLAAHHQDLLAWEEVEP